jgi:hypothetical protein
MQHFVEEYPWQRTKPEAPSNTEKGRSQREDGVFLWSSVRVAKHECYFVLQQQQQVLPCQHDGFNSIALTKINRLMIRNSSFELINY